MEEARDEMPFGLSEDEGMDLAAYKDSLASLTAEKNATVDHLGVIWNGWKPDVGTPLFSAPPVHEIKFPEKCTSDPSMDGMEITYQDGFNSAINEIKQLNKLGD